ncbi:tryptophanase [Candidatus Omnitrophota bacterium]
MRQEISKNFIRSHRLGLIKPFAAISKRVREKILNNVNFNVNMIPGELVYADFITDSLIHSLIKQPTSMGRCSTEASYISLGDTFKKYFGYKHVLPIAQGRMAEIILAKVMAKNAMVIPSNMLFITTRLHQELNGATVKEIPVSQAYDLESEFTFKGNIDTIALRELIKEHGKSWIPYIYVETCVNASGGHPVSMENIREVNQIARENDIPVILDACRILENAYLIKEREKGYGDKSIKDIVKEFCSYSDGATMSATKDFFTDSGGFIATNDEKIYYQAQDAVMVFGDGLSIRAKASLNDAIEKTFRDEPRIPSRLRQAKYLWGKLDRAELPVIKPYGGHAVFLDTKDLYSGLSEDDHPEKAFLAALYRLSGVRAGENILTPTQAKMGIKMLRFAIPPNLLSMEKISYAGNEIISLWNKRRDLKGLKKVYQPPSLSGSFFAEYEQKI